MADVVQPSEPSALQTYTYIPFTNNFTIRILTLEPGTGNDPLVGHLGFENLDLNPQYEAISYCWGTGGRSSEIICDGKPLPLTESIEGALRHKVGHGQAAMEMVHYLHGVFNNEELHNEFKRAHSEDLLSQDRKPWVPFSNLSRLPWFNRIWIVQEIGTAAPATLCWGDAEIDWEILSSVAGILNTTYHFLRSRFAVFTPNIRYLYQRFVEPEEAYDVNHNRAAFLYELHRARHLLSKDPRDHVYAFLGHFSIHTGSSSLAELVADYSRSIEDIYYDVALHTRNELWRGGDVPTWVPDWRVVPLHLMGTPVTPHRASGEYRPQLYIDEETRVLHIYGVRLDRIRRPSWIFWNNAFHFRRNNPFRLPIEGLWRDICGRNQPFNLRQRYRNGESAFFALVQTLTNACIGADRSRPYESIPKDEWLANGAAYLVRALDKPGAVSPEIQELAQTGDGFKWSHEATLVTRYRGFAITFGGWFVVGPDIMQAGDVVVVLYGGRTPFLLRRKDDGTWILVGECYVHGMMNGEVFDLDGVEEEEFAIV
ncbi:Heterokaryon incompatibility [Fusarium oxysporum f. sp. vasinfectum]|nr:Heterokaryon incompatibility [Fusarium oxysporum f. sp. vasinfectum]